MTASAKSLGPIALLRYSAWDALFVGLAVVQGVVLVKFPGVLVIGIGIWWNSNTVSHGFIHNPFFRVRMLNRMFAAYLTVLLGFPHALWRSRHLAHHAESHTQSHARWHWSAELVTQTGLVILLWGVLLWFAPMFCLTVYAPGFALGMALCALHGHYEHAVGTISYHGRLYNLVFFHDGFHVEHHAQPSRHWSRLDSAAGQTQTSRWPPVLRWLDVFSLESLERFAMRSARLRWFLLRSHKRAFEQLLRDEVLQSNSIRVGIVGGGVFPRTAIVLRDLLPAAQITVIDLNHGNLETAAPLMPADVDVVHAAFDPRKHADFDVLVFPLTLRGDRGVLYQNPSAPLVLIHDWIWRRRGTSRVVSWWLLKRLNLVKP
ncbi:MAG: fatty acid desaturase [Planctomycetota bacterium]|nr:fatty acid desaturase [Planctomycetota bacterium]